MNSARTTGIAALGGHGLPFGASACKSQFKGFHPACAKSSSATGASGIEVPFPEQWIGSCRADASTRPPPQPREIDVS